MSNSYGFLKALFVIMVAVITVSVGLFVGQGVGRKEGVREVEAKLRPAIERVFPAPAPEIKVLSGIVKGVYGGTINLEIGDPDDYLPHADGSAPKRQVRYVGVTSATKIYLIDVQKIDRSGSITKTNLALSALRVGDGITVKSDKNIKDAKSFEVTEIEVVRY